MAGGSIAEIRGLHGDVNMELPESSTTSASRRLHREKDNAQLQHGFKAALPAVLQPWPFEFPQAHDWYSQRTACPIDWSTFPSINPGQRYAYEIREPWNPNPMSWDVVGAAVARLEGKEAKLSAEGMRKRFAKANQTIFKETGVYFLLNGHGLQGEYGVPNDSDMAAMLKEGVVTIPGKSDHADPSHKVHVIKQDLLEDQEVVQLVLQPPGHSGYATRHVIKEHADKLDLDTGRIVSCTAATFDRWYSCLCFALRHTIPKRVYRLKQLPIGFSFTDEGIPPLTTKALLDTYCFSQFAGTVAFSDMILDEIHRALRNEKVFKEKYSAGGICDDCNDIVHLLDLTSLDIERLWPNTDIDDPIRRLLVDLSTHELNVDKMDGAVRESMEDPVTLEVNTGKALDQI
jgi:hypothetical protein